MREALAAFEGCGPLSNAKHFLFSSGAPGGLMALDYAPGEAEERGGEPFSGDEARLLDAMMAAMGESRETAYYAYFSPWRPAGGQKLAPHVAAALAPFARRHIELARPKALLLLGDETTKILLATNEPAPKVYARRFRCAIWRGERRGLSGAGTRRDVADKCAQARGVARFTRDHARLCALTLAYLAAFVEFSPA